MRTFYALFAMISIVLSIVNLKDPESCRFFIIIGLIYIVLFNIDVLGDKNE